MGLGSAVAAVEGRAVILALHTFDTARLVELDAMLFALEDALAQEDPLEAVQELRRALREAREAELELAPSNGGYATAAELEAQKPASS